MNDIIQLLPESLANQIAAGEVVQRPASVVKELLENAIDASATQIQLVVVEAGKQLIQITDNGKGMSVTDARMCFERHATSKIGNTQDLFKVRTYGFRGEALASIAAVAQVELKTKRLVDAVGTRVLIEDSKVIVQEPVATPVGTQITVKNLFFNVPARRNFLKSNNIEWRHILDEFVRVALAYPQVGFRLFHNDEEIHNLQPQTNLARRIVALMGKNYQTQLVPVEQKTDLIKVKGYLGKPESAKKTKGEQFLFVNNRFIRHNFLNHAVFSSYENILPKDSYTFFHLNIEIDPLHVDINVHPTKTEVKFDDENFVYNFLRTSVKMSLSTLGVASAIDFSLNVNYLKDLDSPQKKYGSTAASTHSKESVSTQYWQSLFPKSEQQSQDQQLTLMGLDEVPAQPQKWQALVLKNRYLITSLRSGMAVVDVLAAMQRIEYDKAIASFGEMAPSQSLAFPERIELNLTEASILQERLTELKVLGFEIEQLGKGSFSICGVPAEYSGSARELLTEILEHLKVSDEKKSPFRERLALAFCKTMANRKLKNFSAEQGELLAQQLLAGAAPNYSPLGQKALIVVSYEAIEQMFK